MEDGGEQQAPPMDGQMAQEQEPMPQDAQGGNMQQPQQQPMNEAFNKRVNEIVNNLLGKSGDEIVPQQKPNNNGGYRTSAYRGPVFDK